MINFETQFERMDQEYDKLYETYLEFKDNPTYENRNKLARQLKMFGKSKTNFMNSVKNIKLKQE